MKLKLRHFFFWTTILIQPQLHAPYNYDGQKKDQHFNLLFNKMGCNLENLLMSLLESSSSSCCADVFMW